MSVVGSTVKAELKRRIIVFLAPAFGWGLLIFLILAVFLSTGAILKDKVDDFFDSVGQVFSGQTVDVLKAVDELTTENMEDYPFQKAILEIILEAEGKTTVGDREVKIEQKVYESEREVVSQEAYNAFTKPWYSSWDYTKYINSEGEYVIRRSRTQYETVTRTFELTEMTEDYSTPWQLIYAFVVLDVMYNDVQHSNGEFITEEGGASLEAETSALSNKIKVDKNRVEEIIDILSPEYSFANDYFLDSRYYGVFRNTITHSDVESYSDFYGVIHRQEGSTNDRRSVTSYYPTPVLTSVTSYFTKSSFEYEVQRIDHSSFHRENRIVRTDTTSEFDTSKVVEALAYIDASPNDAEILVFIIESLPGGEDVASKLLPVLYEAGAVTGGYININLPLIQGDWTRADLVEMALSLEGKVPYWFGGKYPHYGTNSEWGSLKYNDIDGARHEGEWMPYGLDCSGYVDWVFYQMTGEVMGKGGGTTSQFSNSTKVLEENLLPGDIGFYNYGSGDHVGIYIGDDTDGTPLFVHAGGSAWNGNSHYKWGTVVVTRNYGGSYNNLPESEFDHFRRFPIIFLEEREDGSR